MVCSAVVVATRSSASPRPSVIAQLFSNADGVDCKLPCLFGIQPSQTRFDDALSRLESHPLLGMPQAYEERFDYSHTRMIGFSAYWRARAAFQSRELSVFVTKDGDGTVSQLDFYAGQPVNEDGESITCTASLGELIGVLGVPTMTSGADGILAAVFFFHNNTISASVAPVEGQDFRMGIYRPRPSDCLVRLHIQSPSSIPNYLRWCGFTTRLC
jgi:hypothetical protein